MIPKLAPFFVSSKILSRKKYYSYNDMLQSWILGNVSIMYFYLTYSYIKSYIKQTFLQLGFLLVG